MIWQPAAQAGTRVVGTVTLRGTWRTVPPPTYANANFTIDAGEVVDTSNVAGGKAFYRYRVVQR